MNLLKKYKKMKFTEKQEFLELLLEDLQKITNYEIKLQRYMTIPEFEIKEKSVNAD